MREGLKGETRACAYWWAAKSVPYVSSVPVVQEVLRTYLGARPLGAFVNVVVSEDTPEAHDWKRVTIGKDHAGNPLWIFITAQEAERSEAKEPSKNPAKEKHLDDPQETEATPQAL